MRMSVSVVALAHARWDVQLSVGDRAKITIPPSMGYGKKGFPGLIAPNAKMVFDIEMLNCVDAAASE